MLGRKREQIDNRIKAVIYDRATIQVIALACISIAISMLLMGGISYLITEKAVINKLKSKDLSFIVQSVVAKIDGRIVRAKETSLLLANDPFLRKWIGDGEKDPVLQKLALEKIRSIATNYDYSNTFIVSATTLHYWSENGFVDTISSSNVEDDWFFQTIKSKVPIAVTIDYNKEREDTYVFVNALMGNPDNPVAITGVGLNLQDVSKEFSGYKFGQSGSLWLIDRTGKIHLADNLNNRGKFITDYLPSEISSKISKIHDNTSSPQVMLEYRNTKGELIDLVFQSIPSSDWQLVLQLPRSETIGFLDSIKINTIVASLVTIILVILVFYFVSNRIANPLKRALILSQELERTVEERTRELKAQNDKIMDSIDYAQKVQATIIPPEFVMNNVFPENFVLWQPRDIVGGDFYCLKQTENAWILVLGDCTGHGVPGALMTMAVVPILNHILDDICNNEPAAILKELNKRMKATFQRKDANVIDDGLDMGICILEDHVLSFAGAKIDLYVKSPEGVTVVSGDRQSIGYRKSNSEYEFTKTSLPIGKENRFYLTTDGFLDQNGGPKDYSYGKKRFISLIEDCDNLPLSEQGSVFAQSMDSYRQSAPKRDDITVIGFKCNFF